jgi:hypothetical protein
MKDQDPGIAIVQGYFPSATDEQAEALLMELEAKKKHRAAWKTAKGLAALTCAKNFVAVTTPEGNLRIKADGCAELRWAGDSNHWDWAAEKMRNSGWPLSAEGERIYSDYWVAHFPLPCGRGD